MKKLFIGISIMAVVYLAWQSAIQTDFAKDFDANLWQSSTGKAEMSDENFSSNVQEQKVEFNQVLQAIQTENQALKTKIDELEASIAKLQSGADKSNQTAVDTITDTVLIESSALASQDIDGMQTVSTGNLHDSSADMMSSNGSDQNSKRLQQQAMLRALSQRMELAALSSLTR